MSAITNAYSKLKGLLYGVAANSSDVNTAVEHLHYSPLVLTIGATANVAGLNASARAPFNCRVMSGYLAFGSNVVNTAADSTIVTLNINAVTVNTVNSDNFANTAMLVTTPINLTLNTAATGVNAGEVIRAEITSDDLANNLPGVTTMTLYLRKE